MSSLQKARRKLLRPHSFPATFTTAWQRLDLCCRRELQHLVATLQRHTEGGGSNINLKPLLSAACANIFNAYLCSTERRNYEDPVLVQYCDDFDNVRMISILEKISFSGKL